MKHRRRLATSLLWMSFAAVQVTAGFAVLVTVLVGILITQWTMAWWNHLWGWR